jgi:subtilisin family serine protease
MAEIRPYVVCCYKNERGNRDTFDAHAQAYRDIDGGEDTGRYPAGSRVYYGADLDPEGVEAFLSASNLIYLEEDFELSADSRSIPPHGVEAEALRVCGFNAATRRGESTIVGVLDTGYADHPRYEGRLEAVWTMVGGDGRTRNMHGPWVLGAAMPSRATALPIKVFREDGRGNLSDFVRGLRAFARYCRERRRYGVANFSGSGPSGSRALQDAGAFARIHGVLPVASAGNNGRDPNHSPGYPAHHSQYLGAGAIDHRSMRVAPFTSYRTRIVMSAPGVNLLGDGGRMSGTSMSAPIVSRAGSVVLSETPYYAGNPGRGVRRAQLAMVAGAVELADPFSHVGAGLVHVGGALRNL